MIYKERVVWSAFCVILAIFIIHTFRSSTDEYSQFNYKSFWIEKVHSHEKYDILVCGDSRVYRGISSCAMGEEIPGYRIFNFGFSSGSFSSFMVGEIEKRISVSSLQKVIVLGITPFALTPKAAKDEHIKEELSRKKEEIIECLYFGSLLKIFTPLQLLSINKRRKETIGTPDKPYYHEEYKNTEGWVASWKTPSDPREALESYSHAFEQNQVSDDLIMELMGNVSKWKKQEILVFGFRPPATMEMVELEKKISGFNEDEFIKKFENAGGIWIPVPLNEYSSYDGSHLTKESAIKLSHNIGSFINLFLGKKTHG